MATYMGPPGLSGNVLGVPGRKFSYLLADECIELKALLRKASVPQKRIVRQAVIPLAIVDEREHMRLLEHVTQLVDVFSFAALVEQRLQNEWDKK